jgi:folate-dependent phosphoribosylglycinamide formyltransferase PurN
MTENTLRVCLLFDGETTQRWVAESIETMLQKTNTEISYVVVNEDVGLFGSGNIHRGKRYPAYALLWILALLRPRNGEQFDDQIPIDDINGVAKAPRKSCRPASQRGLWNTLPTDVVETIDERADLVLRRGFGLIEGDILSTTEYGVLSFHHGDPRKYRGGPAGFWEYMNEEDSAGLMVQKLEPELDAGEVLAYHEVDIGGCRTWREIQRRLYNSSSQLLPEAIGNLRDSEKAISVEDPGKIYHPPAAGQILTYLKKEITNRT